MFSKCICLCHCLCLCICLCHCLFVGQVLSPYHSDQMSQRSQVSRIALWWSSLNVFVFVIVFVFVFVSFFGQVMSPHYSDQMSQRSQVSQIPLWWSSLNVFVFVIVFVFVFVTFFWSGHVFILHNRIGSLITWLLPIWSFHYLCLGQWNVELQLMSFQCCIFLAIRCI